MGRTNWKKWQKLIQKNGLTPQKMQRSEGLTWKSGED